MNMPLSYWNPCADNWKRKSLKWTSWRIKWGSTKSSSSSSRKRTGKKKPGTTPSGQRRGPFWICWGTRKSISGKAPHLSWWEKRQSSLTVSPGWVNRWKKRKTWAPGKRSFKAWKICGKNTRKHFKHSRYPIPNMHRWSPFRLPPSRRFRPCLTMTRFSWNIMQVNAEAFFLLLTDSVLKKWSSLSHRKRLEKWVSLSEERFCRKLPAMTRYKSFRIHCFLLQRETGWREKRDCMWFLTRPSTIFLSAFSKIPTGNTWWRTIRFPWSLRRLCGSSASGRRRKKRMPLLDSHWEKWPRARGKATAAPPEAFLSSLRKMCGWDFLPFQEQKTKWMRWENGIRSPRLS